MKKKRREGKNIMVGKYFPSVCGRLDISALKEWKLIKSIFFSLSLSLPTSSLLILSFFASQWPVSLVLLIHPCRIHQFVLHSLVPHLTLWV